MDQIHDAVRQQFSQHAKYYAQSKGHSEGETLGVLVDFAEPNGTEKVLDNRHWDRFHSLRVRAKSCTRYRDRSDPSNARSGGSNSRRVSAGIQNIGFQVASAEALPFEAESLRFGHLPDRTAPFSGCSTISIGNLSRVVSGRIVLHGGFRLPRVGTTH